MSASADDRALEAATEPSRFRAANDRLRRIVSTYGFEAGDRAPFICECADHGCFETVMLSLEGYDRVRTHPTWFVVVAGHEDDEAGHEITLEDEVGYMVVEKVGIAGTEAARLS